MAVSYDNVWFNYILDPIRDFFITEYTYGKVYISPSILHKDPFSIRIWGNSTETISYNQSEWVKRYSNEISLYEIETNPSEAFYKQFLNDSERIYQLLFSKNYVSTTFDSTTLNYYDGVVESMDINEYVGEEEGIEGLNVCRLIFNVTLSRAS
ncbi:hypothetical protein CMI37_23320 [Candidatus Pacearchaeota archaeon]|nr:hypothetical protein [Candidatus Pacearchaeota archaeon]